MNERTHPDIDDGVGAIAFQRVELQVPLEVAGGEAGYGQTVALASLGGGGEGGHSSRLLAALIIKKIHNKTLTSEAKLCVNRNRARDLSEKLSFWLTG